VEICGKVEDHPQKTRAGSHGQEIRAQPGLAVPGGESFITEGDEGVDASGAARGEQ